MEALVALAIVVFLAALISLAFRIGRPRLERRSTVSPVIVGSLARVKLDLDDADPSSPAVQRLAAEVSSRIFATRPDVDEVEVLTRAGRALARLSRTAVVRKMPDLPTFLFEPHAVHHAPEIHTTLGQDVAASGGASAVHYDSSSLGAHSRLLADAFELSEAVRRRLHDADDAVDLVRAVLETAGLESTVDNDLLVVGDRAVVVVRRRVGEPASPEDLNHAYLRFRESGASRGIVVTPGILYPTEVRRRELLAPALQHAGPDGIQRMADAAAVGADPLRFAAAPPLA